MPSRDVNTTTRLAEACWRRDKGSYRPSLLVIRSVSDVLRAQSRLVKFVGGGGVRPQAEPPTHFTNLLWARSTSQTDLITNLSRYQPLFSR